MSVLRYKNAEDLWLALLKFWVALYTGYPSINRVHHEATITFNVFQGLATASGTTVQLSGVESHNSISSGQRYHGPLRIIYSVICRAHPQGHPETALHMVIKGRNDTMGPDGLVPTLLVFGSPP